MTQSSPPGLLIIGNFLSASAHSRSVCEDLATRLGLAGFRVITASGKAGRVARLADMLGTVWQKRRTFNVALIDVYSGNAFIWAEAVCQALYIMGKPYVLTLHGGNLPAFASRWPRRVARLLRSAAAVTTPSRYLQEQLTRFRSDLRVIPNPVDLTAYAFRIRKHPSPRLLWLRAFHQAYNPTLAVRVLARVVGDYPRARLAMIGPDRKDGSLEQAIQVAQDAGVEGRLRVPGRIPACRVAAWMDWADIVLNTSNVDNTPVSVLQALASGTCVVSTNVGGIPYLLDDGQDGLLVPPNDAAAMAMAVSRLLSQPGLAASVSLNGWTKVKRFHWAYVLPAWQELLERAAELAN